MITQPDCKKQGKKYRKLEVKKKVGCLEVKRRKKQNQRRDRNFRTAVLGGVTLIVSQLAYITGCD
jgi:hypothetical protein